MRVFNLTDVATKVLEQRGLVNQHIAVARRMVNPGEFIEVADLVATRDDLKYLLQVGAMSIDVLPPAYQQARQVAQVDPTRPDVRAAHVAMRETKLATGPHALAVGASAELVKHNPLAGVSDEHVAVLSQKPSKGKRR